MSGTLGLDISSTSTGWAVIKNNGRFYKRNGIDYGWIRPKAKLEVSEKLVYFRSELMELLETIQPDLVIAEDTFFFKNPKTLKLLSKFHGVAAEVVRAVLDVPTEIATVKSIRSELGTQGKDQTFSVVAEKFKLTDWEYSTHNDVTDAIAVAYYGHRMYC